ncbi:MAG: putative xanthine dehydrogenase YagT iron-sulfur-binding subunit [Gemmatimonadaceae bacterium]|nr:putative xanthine dehydrogenase YagT iron-sulfur-binding subunit [Gemmatimonadaceae bacterium]
MLLTINGRPHDVHVEPFESLASTLRERLQMLGTKVGCDRGECGTCTVLLDDVPVYSCLVLTRSCEGRRIRTIEGVATANELHPVQRAFVTHDAVQCGYCTPGQVMSAIALLEQHALPSDDEIRRSMSGNLCRCGCYPKIHAAVKSVAAAAVEANDDR